MLEGVGRKIQLPVAGFVEALASIGVRFLPVVEVTDKMHGYAVRRPFAKYPAIRGPMEAEVQVSQGEVSQWFSAGEPALGGLGSTNAPLKAVEKGRQVGVLVN